MNIPRDYLVALQEAQNRLKRQDHKGAIHIGEQLLRAMPRSPGVHIVLGRAYGGIGQTEQALTRLRSAAELAPKEPGIWTEFVTALVGAGQKGRARKVAQKAPLKGPEKKALMDIAKGKAAPTSGPSLGGADMDDIRRLQDLMQSGKPEEVREDADRLLQAHPKSSALLNLAGVAALALDAFDAAEELFQKAHKISPQFAGALTNLGLAQVRQEKIGAAISTFRSALELDPKSFDAHKNLVLAYADAEDNDAAIAQSERFFDIWDDDADVLKAYATAQTEQSRADAAIAAIDRLEALTKPGDETRQMRLAALVKADRIDEAQSFAEPFLDHYPGVRAQYADLKAQLGDLDGAREDLRRSIEEDPDRTEYYSSYGTYTKWTADDPVLPKLKAVIEGSKLARKDEVPALYALAKAHFDLGEDDLAFAALRKANDSQGFAYDVAAEDHWRRIIQDRWSAEAIAALAAEGEERAAPIFIVGTPRSGSTLIEHVIAAHPSVHSIGEDSILAPIFPAQMTTYPKTMAEARQQAAKALHVVPDGTRLLDKYLHNFMRIGALAAAFPRAKFVQTSRDPRAVALSIYRNRFKRFHGYSTDLENIARFFKTYLGYMQHWNTVVGDRIIRCEYETLVTNPEPEIRTLIDSLELEWDDACLRPEAVQKRVKTLSVAQVRSGINTGSSELWKRYETHLAPFTKSVADVWDFDGGRPRNRT